MNELIVFDLDNTLAKSKTVIDAEMSELFTSLLKIKKVAVISGGSFNQFEKELLEPLSKNVDLTNLHIFPTDGTAYFLFQKGKWKKVYQESLSKKEKEKIITSFNQVLDEINFDKSKIIGELIEDRKSDITFSALGQDAPLEIKEGWDKLGVKRLAIKTELEKKLPEFEIHIAGTTSIDVTAKGMNKAYGIQKMIEYIEIPLEKMVFIGDALFVGGNDYPVIATGIKTISVKSPEDTKVIIKDLIK